MHILRQGPSPNFIQKGTLKNGFCFIMLLAHPRQNCTCCLHPLDKIIKKKQQREEAAMMSFSGKYASVFAHLEV